MSLTRIVALGLAAMFLIGSAVLYLWPAETTSPADKTAGLKKRLRNEYRITGLLTGETESGLSTIYLAGYDPVTENFSCVYINGDNLIYSPSFARELPVRELYSALPRRDFVRELSAALETELNFWLHATGEDLQYLVDELGGVKLTKPSDGKDSGTWLDGGLALDYVRNIPSKQGTKELRRRHKSLFIGLLSQLREKNYLTTNENFFRRLHNRIETNLANEELELLLRLARDLKTEKVKFFHAFPGQVQAKVPINVDRVKRMLPRRVKNKIETARAKKIIEVQLYNGTGIPGLASELREKLQKLDFVDVVEIGNADRFDYQKTQIIDRVDHPRSVHRLKKVLGTGELRLNPSTEALADVKLIVGRDIQSYLESEQIKVSE